MLPTKICVLIVPFKCLVCCTVQHIRVSLSLLRTALHMFIQSQGDQIQQVIESGYTENPALFFTFNHQQDTFYCSKSQCKTCSCPKTLEKTWKSYKTAADCEDPRVIIFLFQYCNIPYSGGGVMMVWVVRHRGNTELSSDHVTRSPCWKMANQTSYFTLLFSFVKSGPYYSSIDF